MPEYLRVMIWRGAGFCHFGQAKIDAIRKNGGEEQAVSGRVMSFLYAKMSANVVQPFTPSRISVILGRAACRNQLCQR